ncbi:hypothetical protein [Methylomarinum vadi]|uniref:hypothetical protein n=1 Tax=Methylomarinum vadi TaxID=438855 RepID=UPI001267E3BF|nr:hypothetical protein [Methylomarinum vadi]
MTKFLLIPLAALSLSFSAPLLAKGNPHDKGSDARWRNSNKQSNEYSTRGRERAEERHELKKHKEYEEKYKEKRQKYRDDYKKRRKDYDENHDRYRRQYEQERDGLDRREYRRYDDSGYRQNPVDTIIDRNIDGAKSRIDDMHRRAIESIDNKTREFTGVDTRDR